MIKEKTMRVGLIAVAAFVLVGMLFVPAVAAEGGNSPQDPHYDGSYSILKKVTLIDASSVISILYNDSTNTLYLNKSTGTTSDEPISGSIDLSALFTGLKNEDVKFIEVDAALSLENAANLFSLFINAEGLNYFGEKANVDLFGTAKKIYRIYECESPITVSTKDGKPVEPTTEGATPLPIGTAVLVDTQWAFENQEVKIAVQPLQNFGVYGWDVYKGAVDAEKHPTGTLLAEGTVKIIKSEDPEDSATTYIITMPAYEISPVPKLRDSGSTIVTYVFLNADSYVLEIPADFTLKGVGDTKAVAEKYVELTGCDLLDNHVLSVKMKSENGFTDNFSWGTTGTPVGVLADGAKAFTLKNVKGTGVGAYTIGTKKHYLPTVPANFTPITTVPGDGKVEVLNTGDIATEKALYEKLDAGELKTELQFTLNKISANLGKYKDKLTFTVSIA